MKRTASYSVLLIAVILGVLPLWGKDAYLVFPFEDRTGENLSAEANSAFNIALYATGKGDVIPYHLRSPLAQRLIEEGSLIEEEVTSAPSSPDRAMEIGKLLGASHIFLGIIEDLKEEEGIVSIMERAQMFSVGEGKQVKEAVVTGKSRGKVNGVSREAAIKEALDDAARSLASALVGEAKPTAQQAEVKRKEKNRYYALGALLLGWLIWDQTRDKEEAAVYGLQVTALPYGASVDVKWTSAGANVARYAIKRTSLENTPQGAPWNIALIKDVRTLPFEDLWEVSASQLAYTDGETRIGYAYAYCVVALGKGGEELTRGYSGLVIVGAPATPTGVSAIKIASQTHGYVQVDWQAVSGASSYRIYRSTVQDGPYEMIGTSTGTQYMDSNPLSGTIYYKVSALSAQGAEGLASAPVQPIAEEQPPNPPRR